MLFPGDALIATIIRLGLSDFQKNSFLVDDCFSWFVKNKYLAKVYGQKEIEAARAYLTSNKIEVYMRHSQSKLEFPCITISMGSSNEDKSLATLADQTTEFNQYEPQQIGKSISYVIEPFSVVSYDKSTGTVEMPENENFKFLSSGMLAVDPDTGNGYIIQDVLPNNKFTIEAGTTLKVKKLAIAPKFQLFKARREGIISQESYTIGCHAHGLPANLLYLYFAVKYIILRYREGLFEASDFQLSTIQCSDMVKNEDLGGIGENGYSRYITINGQVQETWIKTPYRFIEAIDFTGSVGEFEQGIKIISNKKTAQPSENDPWVTIEDDEE